MLSRLLSKRTARVLFAPVPKGVVLDADTLELVAELPAGGYRGDAIAGAAGVWFSSYDDRSIALIDPDGTVRVTVDLPAQPTAIALDGDRPVVLCEGGRVLRVDPVGARVTDDVPAPEAASAIVAGDGQVWLIVAEGLDPDGVEIALVQLDPVTLAIRTEVRVGRSRFFGDARIHDGTVSVLHEQAPGCMGYATFDAVSGAPATTPGELTRVRGIGERGGERWLRKDLTIRRIDVASGAELASGRLEVPRVGNVLLAHDRIWAVTYRIPSRGDNEDTD